MPGYIIHAACGTKLIELLNLQDEKEKKNEWNEYMMQVSDWEIEKYLVKM